MMVLLALLGTAFAQNVPSPGIEGNLYRLPIDAEKTLWTDDAGQAPHGYLTGRFALHYVRAPLGVQFIDSDLADKDLIRDAMAMVFAGGGTYRKHS